MDVKFINPFLQGTLEVLKTMAFMDPLPGKVYLKESNIAAGDVSGIIGITGDATGSLAISFTETCICDIVSRMLGESYTSANREVFDAVGEITNMISGVARTHMEKQGMTVYAAIPTVIFGKNHTINPILDSPSIIIPFSTDKGTFVVDVCIKTTASEARNEENYQVINRKTTVSTSTKAPPEVPPVKEDVSPPEVPPVKEDASPVMDRKTLLKNKLQEAIALRDELKKQLSQQPFMEVSKRMMFKKRIPLLDTKIKHLMLDISTMEKLANLNLDALEEPVIADHFQNYSNKK
jgi:chemotaxis protein CheX